MMARWHDLSLFAGDALLGRLAAWRMDAALIALALLTAIIMLLARWLATRRDVLRAAKEDERQLRRCLRAARRQAEHAEAARLRRVRLRVAGLRLREELRAALLALLPVALLVTWASLRLHYVPPRAGMPLTVRVELPAVWQGEVLHIVPRTDLRVSPGWLARTQRIQRPGREDIAFAEWRLMGRAVGSAEPLAIRLRDRTLLHRWRRSAALLATGAQQHGDGIVSETVLPVYRPWRLPDTSPWSVAPWMVVYLPLALLSSLLLQRLLRMP